MEVRLPRGGNNSSGRCGKTVTIAPQPGTYNTPPESSRLIGTGNAGNGNGAACREQKEQAGETTDGEGDSPSTYTFTRHAIRSNYMDKSIEAKKKTVYRLVGSTGVSLVQLLAYISSCCNPITYCFMNRKFRQAFLGVFDCYRCWSESIYCCCCCGDVIAKRANRGLQRDGAALGGLGANNNSDVSGNDSTVFVGRASTGARSVIASEVVLFISHCFRSCGVGGRGSCLAALQVLEVLFILLQQVMVVPSATASHGGDPVTNPLDILSPLQVAAVVTVAAHQVPALAISTPKHQLHNSPWHQTSTKKNGHIMELESSLHLLYFLRLHHNKLYPFQKEDMTNISFETPSIQMSAI
ncbi:hypothetical protein C0J52_16966 [Blattella germanica]|nr:hypothetical protein C0J52_16966 [Blattella germanica]